MKPVRVRFAPSPTGDIHIGNARIALFNYLFSKANNGKFILRIEDTDRERSEKVYEESIINDLNWLGIDYDEGAGKGGEAGPYRQSERFHIYEEFKELLIKKGLIYKCFCQPDFLANIRREQLKRKEPPGYPGVCSKLSVKEIKEKEKAGLKPAYRFRVGKGQVFFKDLVYGKLSFLAEHFGDFIVLRSDGIPAYNFAVVVDDALMKVSHVIRGEDHISNTPLQILICRGIGFALPEFAHIPLLLGADRSPLSKRHGSVSVKTFRESGILPGALIDYLAFLGTSITGDELLSIEELSKRFSFEKISKKGAAFDFVKLSWFNKQSMKEMPVEEIVYHLRPFINREYLTSGLLPVSVDYGKKQAENLKELAEIISPFTKSDFKVDKKVIFSDKEMAVIREFSDILEKSQKNGELNFSEIFREVSNKTFLRGKELYHPVRMALTGMGKGFEMDKIISILPADEVKRRLKALL